MKNATPRLSIVLPYFRKSREFSRVLPLNARFLADPDFEVVLAMDEPSEERQVLGLVKAHPEIRWRVVINDREHPWRPPCRAQNVGIRNSLGEYVLLMDPESAFVTDVPRIALDSVAGRGAVFAVGRVAFATFGQVAKGSQEVVRTAFDKGQRRFSVPVFYGSLCARKCDFEAITGYDERLMKWGADDDNARLRLQLAGSTMMPVPELQLLHLSFESRPLGHASRFVERYTQKEKYRIENPTSAIANRRGWGRDFERVAFDWTAGPKSQRTTHRSAAGARGEAHV